MGSLPHQEDLVEGLDVASGTLVHIIRYSGTLVNLFAIVQNQIHDTRIEEDATRQVFEPHDRGYRIWRRSVLGARQVVSPCLPESRCKDLNRLGFSARSHPRRWGGTQPCRHHRLPMGAE